MTKRTKVSTRKRSGSPSLSWLDSSGEQFVQGARKLVSARGRTTRDHLLREGLGKKFAEHLLSEALRESVLQVECWTIIGKLWADEAWQAYFRNASAEGTPPPPRSFVKIPLAPIAQALLGLYGEHALAWCVYAYLISSGQATKRIEHAIAAHAFNENAFIEAVEAALKELDLKPRLYPRGVPGRVANLLLQRLTSDHTKLTATKIGALPFTRGQAISLVQPLLWAKLSDASLGDTSPEGDTLEDALAETAWMEADESLARALQQTPALRDAIREPTKIDPCLWDQLGEIVQAVRASAAKRELEIEGEPGSEVAFDPVKHAQDDPRVKAAKLVRIITPTVYQGRGANRRVLRVADVEPA